MVFGTTPQCSNWVSMRAEEFYSHACCIPQAGLA